MNKILIEKEDYRAIWGSLTEICEVYKLPYHSIKDKPYPIKINGFTIRKLKYRTK